jgi:hypothetical protein
LIVIGIRNPELGQNNPLEELHDRRRTSRLMVVAEQMKDAVHDQVSQMIGERLILLGRFASHCLECKHDISKQERRAGRGAHSRLRGWKREYIGRRILPPEEAIEPLLLGVVGKYNA